MPIGVRVPDLRPEPALNGLKVGLEPTSLFWADVADACNYLRGIGSVLVPACTPEIQLTSGSETLRFRTRPSGRQIARVWVVKVRSGNQPGRARATVTADGTSVDVIASAYTIDSAGIAIVVGTASKTTAATEITCTVTWLEGTVVIDSIECWELPRALLTQDATDLGVDVSSLDPDRPIVDRAYESFGGIGAALSAADGRRIGLAHGWLPVCSFTTADTYFETGIRIAPPKLGVSDTTRVCDVNVYARVTNGTTVGRVRAVRQDGTASAWQSITATTFAWIEWTHTFKCEDMATGDGIPSGTWETLTFEFEVTSGAGSIEVRGYGCYDGIW